MNSATPFLPSTKSSKAWARLVAFGCTRKKFSPAAADPQLVALRDAGTRCVAVVAKSHEFHVKEVLRVPLEEGIAMVADSVAFLKNNHRDTGRGDEALECVSTGGVACPSSREVMVDLEHFFDGFKANPTYSLAVCAAARDAGADCLVLW